MLITFNLINIPKRSTKPKLFKLMLKYHRSARNKYNKALSNLLITFIVSHLYA